MKTALTLLMTLFLLTSLTGVQAQDLGSMLTQIADGIKPEAFSGKFNKNKDEWKERAASLYPSDLSAVSDQVGGLLKGLKGNALAKGVKKDLLNGLANIGSLFDVGKLLSSLVKGINPSMLTGIFANNKDLLTRGLEMLGD
ncbi:hypothetical protein WJR50_26205 [Catalinimonas sp. 4WD22]|uniref:hypothetical protein n=1 Tax=Catalinimonas locisalis TaxID=3133978 RepID=UPI0031010170